MLQIMTMTLMNLKDVAGNDELQWRMTLPRMMPNMKDDDDHDEDKS